MRSLSSLLLIAVLAATAGASSVFDPTDIGAGARPLGLGKAYTAIANDSSAVFTNPAGLALSKSSTAISMFGSLMNEVPYTMFGGSYPALNGTVGFGYVGLGVSGIKETVLVGNTPEVTGTDASFANSALNLSYATDLKRDLGVFKNVSVGGSIKLISQGFSGGASFESGNGGGVDLDLGAISSLNDETTVGLTLKNLIPGNNLKSDELPMGITAGVAKKFVQYNLLTAVDAELSRGLLLHAGAEWSPTQMLRLRLGLDQKPSAGSATTNLAMGMGVNFKGYTFDYAYHTYAELSEFATHFFSIGFVGEAKAAAIATPALKP